MLTECGNIVNLQNLECGLYLKVVSAQNLLNLLLFPSRWFVLDFSPDGDVLAVLLVVVEQLLALGPIA